MRGWLFCFNPLSRIEPVEISHAEAPAEGCLREEIGARDLDKLDPRGDKLDPRGDKLDPRGGKPRSAGEEPDPRGDELDRGDTDANKSRADRGEALGCAGDSSATVETRATTL